MGGGWEEGVGVREEGLECPTAPPTLRPSKTTVDTHLPKSNAIHRLRIASDYPITLSRQRTQASSFGRGPAAHHPTHAPWLNKP